MSVEPSMRLIDAVHMNRDIIDNVLFEMRKMANAFYLTGNATMGEQLDDWVATLDATQKQVLISYSMSLSQTLNDDQKAFVDTMAEAFNGKA